jgi:hypothetical protein
MMNARMRRRRGRWRSGVAMTLVLSTVSVAVICGIALLATSGMSARVARNAVNVAEAEALADSGIDMASYYLFFPSRAPAFGGSHWPGATGLKLTPTSAGTVNIVVTSLGNDDYRVVSTGVAESGTTQERRAIVHVSKPPPIRSGVVLDRAVLTLPASINFNSPVEMNGALTSLGVIKGNVMATAFTNLGSLLGSVLGYNAANATRVTSSGTVRDYRTYAYQGVTYSAKPIADTLPAGTVLGPTADNPLGVFYRNGVLNLASNTNITGMLLVEGGPVNVNGGNNVVTSVQGLPAAIVKGDMYLRSGSARNLTFNGFTWTSGTVRSSGIVTGGTFNFNGAVMFAGGTVDTLFGGKANAVWDPESTVGVDLDNRDALSGVTVKYFR